MLNVRKVFSNYSYFENTFHKNKIFYYSNFNRCISRSIFIKDLKRVKSKKSFFQIKAKFY